MPGWRAPDREIMASSTTAQEHAQLEANRRDAREHRDQAERELDRKLEALTGVKAKRRVVLDLRGQLVEVPPHQLDHWLGKGARVVGKVIHGEDVPPLPATTTADPLGPMRLDSAAAVQESIDGDIDDAEAKRRAQERRNAALIARFEP